MLMNMNKIKDWWYKHYSDKRDIFSMELNSLTQNFHGIVALWNAAIHFVFMELVTKTSENENFYLSKSYFNVGFSETLRINLISTNMTSDDKNKHVSRIEFLFPTINRY